jgi:hypothetical protein
MTNKSPPKDPGKGPKSATSGLRNWANKTGKSFRAKGENGKQFPHERPADISK